MAARPTVVRDIRANRAFMQRAVSYLTDDADIRQFLDVGSGIPTSPNVHEIAQEIAPDARIVYADNDRCKPGCVHARWACSRCPRAGRPASR
jgi:hypothetical protein